MEKKIEKKVPPFFMVQIGKLVEDFQSEAAKFSHMMTAGGGIRNMGMLDTLRRLQFIYLQVAAHLDAARDMAGGDSNLKVVLEDGIEALEYVRELEAKERSNGK